VGKAIRVTKMDKDSEKERVYQRAYREKNKEKTKLYRKEYYQKNRETLNQKSISYAQNNTTRIKEYHKEYHVKMRIGVLAKIDPTMKCVMCGCDDTRFLEVNHIKGGGNKEQKRFKEDSHSSSQNIIMLIHKGKRGTFHSRIYSSKNFEFYSSVRISFVLLIFC